MTYSFGTRYTPGHFFEVPDETYVDPDHDANVAAGISDRTRMVRPRAGYTFKVRDATTLADLPDVTTTDYGYWSFTDEAIKSIRVSVDDWATAGIGPLIAVEAELEGVQAGTTAIAAQTQAAAAAALAQQAIDAVNSGSPGGGVGTVTQVAGVSPDVTGNVPLTAASVGARPSATPVPAASVSGLASVATSGSYNDLSNQPPTLRVTQNVGGTWPNRPATSLQVSWYTQPGNTTPPATSGTTSGGVGMIPNFDLYIEMP